MKTYTTLYRPPGYGTLPRGKWDLMERGTGRFFEGRVDLPVGNHQFGAFTFERDLTDDELKAYEIRELRGTCTHRWEEQPGEPPQDVCYDCGEVRE